MASLFDPQPKSDPKYLYGRDKELSDLVRRVRSNDWVILMGPRRVGKTSLARCAATRLKLKTIVIDARIESDIVKGLANSLADRGAMNVQGSATMPKTPIAVSASYTKTSLGQTVDQLLSKVKRLLVIVDEAQWLRNPRSVTMLMAHVYDYYYERVTFVITGSAVGVMRAIVEPGAKSPLFGRAITTVEIKKWNDPSTSLGFLKKGCAQREVSYSEDELVQVVDTLDGIPGWLTLFGYHYAATRDLNKAIGVTRSEALKIVKEELESTARLALGWQRQLRILKAISEKSMKFNEIARELNLTDKALSRNLGMLQRLQYVENDEEKNYVVIDPIVKAFMKT